MTNGAITQDDLISENDFDEQYKPMRQTKAGDMLSPDYRGAQAFAESQGLNEKHIWSVRHGDEDDSMVADPGPGTVNVAGYVVTEKAWETGDEIAVYFEDDMDMGMDEDDDDLDEGPAPGM
ncbi:MAG: hypothetical protein AWU57_39 [Marinobacter sp. T13-3]|nr:MAG: hypothetical protein AWU57_39 [Marinobacter sp. T13-3]